MTPNGARVFVTHDTKGLDFSRAREMGELACVCSGPVDVFNPDTIRRNISEQLKGFNYKKDYLLISGQALVAGFALLALSAREPKIPHVQLMLYDSKKKDYFIRTISI